LYCPSRECPDVTNSGLAGEYRAGIYICPKCGTKLVDERPGFADAYRAEDDEPGATLEYQEFVAVLRIHNTAVIPVVKSVLQSAGIRHFVKNERTHDLMGYPRLSPGGYNPILGAPEVLVEPERADEAREILAGVQEP
jgi:hypothetical protein